MLSIIIPTLNEEKNLTNIINNIRKQNFSDLEIIVSDGNSGDKTKDIALMNNCKFISSDKKSPAHQRNKGVEIASGDYLLFLDADSYIPKNFIDKAISEFKNRHLGVASFYLKFNSKNNIYKLYNLIYNILCYIYQYFKPLAVGAAILVKKENHHRIKGFDENIYVAEDHEYARRIGKIDKFRMIKSTFFLFSPRRWEKEGHFRSIMKLIKMSLYMTFFGPIKKKIIDYDFGKY